MTFGRNTRILLVADFAAGHRDDMRDERTEVLVVGAGPVGLWTALLLAKAGIEVAVIDHEQRTTTRSYACALHPRTLKLLHRHDLAKGLVERGRKAVAVAFCEGTVRHTSVNFTEKGSEFPFLLILPQNILETTLEQKLREAGVNVLWNHRFDDFEEEVEAVAATVERLGGTSTGYIVPHWETVVEEQWKVHARFLLGADGLHSLVRERAGIECERISPPEFFAAYEFSSDEAAPDEVRVVLDDFTTNVLWPLPGNRARWTFQLAHSSAGFPEKERRTAMKQVDEKIRGYVQRVAKSRAPWFTANVQHIAWCTEVAFERRMAREFGRNGCWLLGDAAHQTGPVGVQSMNAGFVEAEALVGILKKILRDNAPATLLDEYQRQQRDEWRRLLGATGGLQPRRDTDSWVASRAARILPCLPGTGAEVVRLAEQLRLDLGI
jgi:2-polyprenyl-6-methoxyphenol hydroxylase-like FAD-dependent oxidoreductase